MLEILKNSLLMPYATTLKLQSCFHGREAQEGPEDEVELTKLIQSIYIPKKFSEDIIPLFFIIPKTIEGLLIADALNLIRCIS